jgi:hypothetical protein
MWLLRWARAPGIVATLAVTARDQDPSGKKYVMAEDPVANSEVPIMY